MDCIQARVMRALTVRNVPDDLYLHLTTTAKKNRRSLQQQVLSILEHASARSGDDTLTTAATLRRRLAGRALGDTVEELREERAR